MRPYEPLNMTTKKWRLIEPVVVDINLLIPSQNHLYDDISKQSLISCGDPYIHVVLYKGIYYISDGHHRVDKFKKSRCRYVLCRLLEKTENHENNYRL